MDYIEFKQDGSLKEKQIKQYIMQGSVGVNKFFVILERAASLFTCQAFFTLPNAEEPQMPNEESETVVGIWKENYPYEADDPEELLNDPTALAAYTAAGGKFSDGWVITLEEEETLYPGLLIVAIRIIVGSLVLVQYPFSLIVNETGVMPKASSGITLEQLDSYLLMLQNYPQKGSTLITSGTFLNGYIKINKSLITNGLYFFTYGNVQSFILITSEMIAASNVSPIRSTIPVIYGQTGQTDTGNLRIEIDPDDNTKLRIRVATEEHAVKDGYVLNIYKTNLL